MNKIEFKDKDGFKFGAIVKDDVMRCPGEL